MAATPDQRRDFGRRLRELREAKGLTQPSLGALLGDHGGSGVSGPAVSDWERGVSAPDQRNAAVLEAIFGEPLAERLGYRVDGASIEQRVLDLEAVVAELREENLNQSRSLAEILRRLDGRR